MNRRPNLFIIGAMKSGTTTLCKHLGAHPDIFMSPVKEPMHFSREEHWRKGEADYLKLFSEVAEERYLAEGSTEYAKLPFRQGVAQRIHDFNPRAQFIYLMRDPFERIVSQYKHMARSGKEMAPLRHAIKRGDYITNSYYALQIRPYLDLFGRQAVFFDTFESFISAPEQLCRNIYEWLNIDAALSLPQDRTAYNISPSKLQSIDENTVVGNAVVRLKRSMPGLPRLIPAFARKWLLSSVPSKCIVDFTSQAFQEEVEVVGAALRPILCKWIGELEDLTDRTYRDWTTCIPQAGDAGFSSALTGQYAAHLDRVLGDTSWM